MSNLELLNKHENLCEELEGFKARASDAFCNDNGDTECD